LEKLLVIRVLLIESDEQSASALASAMKYRYFVALCAAKLRAIEAVDINGGDFDVVILDLSADRREDWGILEHLCRRVAGKAIAPAILCFSRVYKGARMRLEAQRKGARFIYVH
jgi:DNA-binding response OmpR family regulator